jgi:hypothetical protein
VILPADTGGDRIDGNDVKKIGRGNEGKKRDEYGIERLHAFDNVTIELIEPNGGLNPATCEGENIKSTE